MSADRESLRTFIAHSAWADRRVADAISATEPTDERLMTWFAHVVRTGEIYFERLLDEDPWPQEFWPRLDLDACREVSAANAERYRGWLETASDADLDHRAAYRDTSGRRHETAVRRMIEHVAIHAAHHRGQIAARLRRLGHDPPAIDYINFLRERSD